MATRQSSAREARQTKCATWAAASAFFWRACLRVAGLLRFARNGPTDSPSRHLAPDRRPCPHWIEQRVVALLHHVALRKRRPRLLTQRQHHAVVAVVAKQHHANEMHERRATVFAK